MSRSIHYCLKCDEECFSDIPCSNCGYDGGCNSVEKPSPNDTFSKWKWMMDYCHERKWPPADFWDLAEKRWKERHGKKI